MGNSSIACKCLTSVFKDSCGALNVDVVDSVELTEQRGSPAAKQTAPVACVSDDLKCGRAREVCDSKSTTPYLEKEGRRKRHFISFHFINPLREIWVALHG